jgi:hypothetical protein
LETGVVENGLVCSSNMPPWVPCTTSLLSQVAALLSYTRLLKSPAGPSCQQCFCLSSLPSATWRPWSFFLMFSTLSLRKCSYPLCMLTSPHCAPDPVPLSFFRKLLHSLQHTLFLWIAHWSSLVGNSNGPCVLNPLHLLLK